MVNNEGVSLDEMPKSMSKKWTKAQYGRERYLAKEFLKSKSEQLSEGSLKQAMQQWKYIEKGLKPKQKKLVQKALKRLKPKMDKNFKNKDYQDYIDGELDIKVPLPDLIFGKGKEFAQLITAYSNAIKEPAFYEGKLTSEQKLRSMIRGIIEEQIRHTNARFLYVPKNDFKKAKNIFKSDIKKGRVEIEPKPSPKVKGFYRMTVNKQDFDDYVEELMMKRINVKTIAQGKA